MQSFAKPLTPAEERHFLRLCEDGDLHARNILVEHNLRLVAHIVKKYNSPERDLDDLISIGTIGLIKAINTYQKNKGNRLVTYASRCIENELLMMVRQEKKSSKEISLYEPIGIDREGNEINFLDIVHTENESVINHLIKKQNIKCLYKELLQMPDTREKTVLILRYGLFGRRSHTQREVASYLGISRSYVSRIEKKAIQSLRIAMK